MPVEFPEPGYEYDVSRHDDLEPDKLSEQNAEILRQFEDWLRSSETEPPVSQPCDGRERIGLYQLYEALTSQRQELKLLTKSGRQTQELLAKSMEETTAAVELLQRFHRDKPDVERKAVKPFLMSLVEMDESLERATAAANAMLERMTELFGAHIERCTATYCERMSFWTWFWKRKIVRNFALHISQEQQAEMERIFQPFREGFEILRQRMSDVLKKHAIQRLNPKGEPLNPKTMQVISVVESEQVPPGHVVDVIRPGYLRHGIPLRFADVRAAR
jgi:molecular chaperone GrpE (heat shock protein)